MKKTVMHSAALAAMALCAGAPAVALAAGTRKPNDVNGAQNGNCSIEGLSAGHQGGITGDTKYDVNAIGQQHQAEIVTDKLGAGIDKADLGAAGIDHQQEGPERQVGEEKNDKLTNSSPNPLFSRENIPKQKVPVIGVVFRSHSRHSQGVLEGVGKTSPLCKEISPPQKGFFYA